MRKAIQEERGAQMGCVPHAGTPLVCIVPSEYLSRQQSGQALIWGFTALCLLQWYNLLNIPTLSFCICILTEILQIKC